MTSVMPTGGDFVTIRGRERALNQTNYNDINALEQVIGRIPDHIKHDYVDQQSRAYGDLTELLIKRVSPVVSNYVTGLLREGYISPFTSFLLPIRTLLPNEGITVKWTELNFDPGLIPQVESEGVAPIFTHNATEKGARAVRRAGGIKITSDFYMTPEGREEWKNKIDHLAAIVQRTNEFGVMMTLLQTPWDTTRHANELNGPYNVYGGMADISFEERLKMEIEMFGTVNKSIDSRGFSNLCTSIRTNMRRHGVKPDAIVVPPFMLGYYYFTKPDLWNNDSAGAESITNRQRAVDIGGDSAYRSFEIQGMKVVDVYVYRPTEGGDQDAVDVLSVPTQVGEFYPVEIANVYSDLSDFARYKTRSRNIRLFNERHGRIVPVKFQDMIKSCLRWEDEEENTTGALNGRLHSGDIDDMFVKTDAGGNTIPVSNWGEIDVKYISAQHHLRVIKTFMNSYSSQEASELNALLNRYREMAAPYSRQPSRLRTEAGVYLPRAGDVYEAADEPYVRARNQMLDVIKTTLENRVKTMVSSKTGHVSLLDLGYFLRDNAELNDNSAANFFNLTRQPGSIQLNPDLVALGESLTPLEKLIFHYWVDTPINRKTMLTMADNDIYIPVNFLLSRPYMTYVTSSCIFMKAGTETGETIIGRSNFMLTSDNHDGTMYGSYQYYSGHYIKRNRNVVVAPNVFIQSYVKGNDTTFIKYSDMSEIQEKGGMKTRQNSILSFMIPPDSNVMQHNIIDIRGQNADLRTHDGLPFFPSSDYYYNVLRIDDENLASPADAYVDYDTSDFKCKSLCCLGHFEYGENFSQINTNTGHLGPNTYDQINLSRSPGQYVPVKQITYNSRIIQ